MKGILLTQETNTFAKANSLQIAQNPQSAYKQNEESTVDCPDCFDTMIKTFELDKIQYYCENCDLVIPEMEVQTFVD